MVPEKVLGTDPWTIPGFEMVPRNSLFLHGKLRSRSVGQGR